MIGVSITNLQVATRIAWCLQTASLFAEDKKDVVAALKSSGNKDIKLVRDFKVFRLKKKKYSQTAQCEEIPWP